MIDRLAIMSPTLNLYGLRTRAGFAAERPEVVVESVSNYARLAAGMVQARASIRRSRCARTPARCAMYSTTWPNFRSVDAARIAEVRAEIAALTSNLGTN